MSATATAKAKTKSAVPAPDDLWDRALFAALSGTASEVRLTASEIVTKASSCADRVVDAWTAHYNPPEVPINPGDLATVNIAPTSDSVAATAETSSFSVTITDPGTWTAVVDPAASAWLSVVSPAGPQNTDATVNYATTANTGATRTGTITVNTRTFTVLQAGT